MDGTHIAAIGLGIVLGISFCTLVVGYRNYKENKGWD